MAKFEDLEGKPGAYGFSGGNWIAHFAKGRADVINPDAIKWLRSNPRFKEIFEAAGPDNTPVASLPPVSTKKKDSA